MSEPFTLNWGILATGMIASKFTKDLLIPPKDRQVSDVNHQVVAAASSSSSSRAKDFLVGCGCPPDAKAYGSYKELVADANVNIIYIATPHSHHFESVMLCLIAGKHVLCEKPLTVNAKQSKILIEEAKKRKLFLMEAVWTRFFPLSRKVRSMLKEGRLGQVHRVIADLSIGTSQNAEEIWGTEHRMVNMDLAGGALLDLGIYSLTWIFQMLYHIQPAADRKPPSVTSSMCKYPKTGADELTSMILTFPNIAAHGIALTSIRVETDPNGKGSAGPTIKIQGTKGEIDVYGPASRPEYIKIIDNDPEGKEAELMEFKIPGHGMFWEADECARCLRDGKLESEGMPMAESLVIMDVMDQVRKQNGLVYPEAIETTAYKF